MSMSRAEELVIMFNQVNMDAEANGDQVVPLTDVKYYAEQLVNLYQVSHSDAVELAEEMAVVASKDQLELDE
jgi:hypothetical protein